MRRTQSLVALIDRTLRLVLHLTVFATLYGVSAVASQAADRWEPAGFGGSGNYLSVHVDTSQPGVVYAASDAGGLFRSADYGEHWVMRNDGLGNYEVASFAIDPFDPDTLYAGVGAFPSSEKAGLYVSHDAGLTWRHLRSTAKHRIAFRLNRTRQAIAPDPRNRGVIVSGSRDNGVWRSSDGGRTWNQVLEAPSTAVRPIQMIGGNVDDPDTTPYAASVSVAVFDPGAAGVVYAGFYGAGVYRSDAGGVAGSWRPASKGLPDQSTVLHLAVGPEETLYAALGAQGVYKSADGGAHWTSVSGDLPLGDIRVVSVAVHPADPAVAYIVQSAAADPADWHAPVWKTEDGGAHWRETGRIDLDDTANPTDVWSYYPTSGNMIALDPSEPDRLFFTNAWGIYRSDDAGGRWSSMVAGAQATCVRDLAFDEGRTPDQPGVIFAAHLDAGLLASRDRGKDWAALIPDGSSERRLAGHFWRVLVVRDGNSKSYYAAGAPWLEDVNVVMHSRDGNRWRRVLTRDIPPGGRGLGVVNLTADPSRPELLYFVQDGGQVLKTEDGGKSWAPTTAQPAAQRFNDLAVDDSGRVFVATFWKGVWRSNDGGESWEQVLKGRGPAWDLDVASDAVYAALGDGNLYQSRDGGGDWRRLTNFPRGSDSDGTGNQGIAVGVDPQDPAHIIFSRADTWHYGDLGSGAGLIESTDGGATWRSLNEGLGMPRVAKVLFAPNGDLYAGTICGGVWRFARGERATATNQ